MNNFTDLELQCLAHRYLYYVLNRPEISDYEYDKLERDALSEVGETSPIHEPGSDILDSYPQEAIQYAKRLSIHAH